MTPEEAQRLQECVSEIAAILYRNTAPSQLTTLEAIETTVRQQMLEHVSPHIALFLPLQTTQTRQGKPRQIKSCLGILKLRAKQAQRLGLSPRSQLSPLLEKCCLRLSANMSYQSAESEIEALTGMKVSHSTQQRRVLKQEFPCAYRKASDYRSQRGWG